MVTFINMSIWLLLSSRLPREPTRLRLAIWRRLKRLGALLLHDTVWVLPADAKTREHFEWLAEEIEEHGGTVFTWEAQSFGPAQDRVLVGQFRAEADGRYAAIAASAGEFGRLTARRKGHHPARLRQALRQLAGLERALRLERRRDYFKADGRAAAEAAVQEATHAIQARLPTAPTERGHDAVGY